MKVTKDSKDLAVKDPSVFEKIVNEHGKKLPLMTRLMKSEGIMTVNFSSQNRVVELMQQIVAKSDRFKTFAEINRAAYYLGMHLIYHMTYDKSNEEANNIYNGIFSMQKINYDLEIISGFVENFEKMKRHVDSGLMSIDKMVEEVMEQVANVPKRFRKELKKRAELLIGGAPLGEVSDVRKVGNPGSKVQSLENARYAKEILEKRT